MQNLNVSHRQPHHEQEPIVIDHRRTAGCYQHHVPAVCDEVNQRSEFLTAYAGEPYDNHSRFQAPFEYASMMGELLKGAPVWADYRSWETEEEARASTDTAKPVQKAPKKNDPWDHGSVSSHLSLSETAASAYAHRCHLKAAAVRSWRFSASFCPQRHQSRPYEPSGLQFPPQHQSDRWLGSVLQLSWCATSPNTGHSQHARVGRLPPRP